jgi:hypothetical protein
MREEELILMHEDGVGLPVVMAAKAFSNSSTVRTATGWSVRPSARAASSISRNERSGIPGFGRFDRSATREMPGTASLISSNRFPRVSIPMTLTPVLLPPGRARLVTSPIPTGSPTCAMTMEIVRVACWAARLAGVPL